VSINDFSDTDDNKWCNTKDNKWRGIWDPSESSGKLPPESKEIGIGTSVGSGDYGRKPYISKNYYEMMKRPPLAAIQNELKAKYGKFEPKSEFEKPYLSDSYEEMQHYQPPPFPNFAWPNWPEMQYPEFSGPMPDQPGGWIGSYIVGCSLTCTPSIIRDCDAGIEFCCTLNPAWQPVDKIIIQGPATLTRNGKKAKETGDKICFTLDSDAKDGDTIKIVIITKPREADGRSGSCVGSFKVACSKCDCETADAFTYDDATSDDTIDRPNGGGETATIAITGGCPRYSWSVAGTGFSLTNATTTGLTNTLNADATACGSATITITDDCGTVATGYVRCTTGGWALDEVICSSTGCGYASGWFGHYSVPDGKYKYYFRSNWVGCSDIVCYCNDPCFVQLLALSGFSPTADGYSYSCNTTICSGKSVLVCKKGGSEMVCGDSTLTRYIWGCA